MISVSLIDLVDLFPLLTPMAELEPHQQKDQGLLGEGSRRIHVHTARHLACYCCLPRHLLVLQERSRVEVTQNHNSWTALREVASLASRRFPRTARRHCPHAAQPGCHIPLGPWACVPVESVSWVLMHSASAATWTREAYRLNHRPN